MVLVFDELANGQAESHYSWHRLRTRRPACPLLISSKTKPRQFRSVQLCRSVRALIY